MQSRHGFIHTPKGICLSYADSGNADAPTVIFIMGLGAPLTVWPAAMCEILVDQGYRVIRFDNRDSGLSSRIEKRAELTRLWLQRKLKRKTKPPYKLKHMAKDVRHLMDALEVDRAHLVGASMGGMIAQTVAAKHPERILSLTSIMSTTSAPHLPSARWSTLFKIGPRPKSSKKEDVLRYVVKMNKLVSSPEAEVDEDYFYRNAKLNWRHSHRPAGVARQLAAIMAAGDRSAIIRKVKAPTLVIHGADDPIMPLEGGIDTAKKAQNAKLKVIPQMGHNLPPELHETLGTLIAKHVSKAQRKHHAKEKLKARKRKKSN